MRDVSVLNKNSQSGQLMIEAIVAVSLILVGLMGAFTVLTQSLGLNRVAADQYVAVGLASEGLELVKNIVDQDAIPGGVGGGFGNGVPQGNYYVLDYATLTGAEMDKKSSPGQVPFLNFDPTTGLYSYGAGNTTKFKRYVNLEDIDLNGDSFVDMIRATVVVTWVGRGGIDFDLQIEDHFYNWRTAP